MPGTSNVVQSVLGISAVQAATFAAIRNPRVTAYPTQLQHGALEANWPDVSLIAVFNKIWQQTNSMVRI